MFAKFRNLLAAGSVAILAACGGGGDDQSVLEIAQSDTRFSILAEAVVAADLTATVGGSDPITLFAPTNDAFVALLGELGLTKDQLLADKALLTTVLTYHVVPGKVAKSAVPVGKAITTAQGGIFKAEVGGSALTIQDGRNRVANVVETDIGASNGVVHVLDKVLLPADKNVVETAQSLPDFSILVEAVVAADLQGALSADGPLTVFAPTNAAFAALLDEIGMTKDALLADKTLLTSVLRYHVVGSRTLKADVPIGMPIGTLEPGKTFTVGSSLAITDGSGRISNITATDVLTSNGVIHVIDKVLLPSP